MIESDGLSVRETIVKERQYSFKEVRRYTQISRCNKSVYLRQKYDDCMTILKTLIKKYRWELFNTHDGLKIMINGYGDFNHIETHGLMDKKKTILASTVYNKLERLVKEV